MLAVDTAHAAECVIAHPVKPCLIIIAQMFENVKPALKIHQRFFARAAQPLGLTLAKSLKW